MCSEFATVLSHSMSYLAEFIEALGLQVQALSCIYRVVPSMTRTGLLNVFQIRVGVGHLASGLAGGGCRHQCALQSLRVLRFRTFVYFGQNREARQSF